VELTTLPSDRLVGWGLGRAHPSPIPIPLGAAPLALSFCGPQCKILATPLQPLQSDPPQYDFQCFQARSVSDLISYFVFPVSDVAICDMYSLQSLRVN